ncbi:MAG: isoprenyl transferase [Crocinitomicaceae bacterium]|jgi:undecaprenyl diphosphate synthase|nr:isoprenyl transferase [Crocinitomicaceae bacterium]MCF8410234.1 isoprenyl transferase [Crocinitomicaceae bacterium]MCF8443573.1 isoprenyl transferase [Crocinitomicaceae bacterium]
MSLEAKIDYTNIPKHIAVIMDGNGRWAKQQGQDRLFGHTSGVESVRSTIKVARELGIKFLTLYAFSTENWNRPKEEVDGLMDLLVQSIANEVDELNENGIRLITIGDDTQLPRNCQEGLAGAREKTKDNTELTLVLALNYSARWEIMEGLKKIAVEIENKNLTSEQVNEQLFESYLSTKNIPDPELLIRTSGENRVSNFLLWQIAYTEFHFTDIFWPEFRKEHFLKAILDYQARERRFGLVSEQIQG